MAAPKKVDYEHMLPGWRAGVLSPAQLAAEYTAATGISCSAAAVRKHFTKLGIPRDLTAQVRAKADALVLEAGVAQADKTKPVTRAVAALVDQAALDSAAIQLAHRLDIRRGREALAQLQTDLEAIANHQEVAMLLKGLSRRRDDDTDESQAERVASAIEMVIKNITARANITAKLVETLKHIIPLERQAWKIDTGGTPPPPPSAEQSQSAEEAYKRMLGSV